MAVESDFESNYLEAPRIQIILIPEGGKIAEHGEISDATRFEPYMLLHMPDGKPPNTIKLRSANKESLSRDECVRYILKIYEEISERHAFPGEDMFPERPATQ